MAAVTVQVDAQKLLRDKYHHATDDDSGVKG